MVQTFILFHRPLESHYWKIWSEMPHTRSIVEKVVLPEIVDEILPIGGMYMPAKRISQIFMGEPVEKNKCVIYQDKVKVKYFFYQTIY